MLQYRARWSGGRIGSGYSVFNVDGAIGNDLQGVADEIRLWFSSRSSALPNDVTISFEAEVKELTVAGNLISIGAVTAPGSVTGGYSGDWSSSSGRVVRWTTADVVGGRRLIGHTFLVPSAQFTDSSGSVLAGTISADATAHAALIAGLSGNGTPLVVWSRRYATTGEVTLGQTLARPVSLRSRND